MRRYQPLVLLVVCAICLAHAPCVMTGCQSTGEPRTEKARLKITAEAYASAKQSVADAWEAGLLDRDEKVAVMKWVRMGDKALERWRKRLKNGGPTKTPRETLQRATRILSDLWLENQNINSSEEGDTQ